METAPHERTLPEKIVFLIAAVAVVVATFMAARLALSARTGTVDSYYYFARTADLNDGANLAGTRINWGPEGVDRKFFPGYPELQHSLTFGSQPERSWRSLSVFLVLVDGVLLGFAFRRLGLSFFASCAAVAMFETHSIPLRWMTMPMAEGAALLYLCLSAIALPAREDRHPVAYVRFLVACLLGGMAILCRAEASYISAALGLVGCARLVKRPGWLPVAAAGAVLGILPFAYWVTSLPPAAAGQSRLHYVNEFLQMFSWRDTVGSEGAQGGVIDNFGRSWLHVVRNFGRNPFDPHTPEIAALLGLWVVIYCGSVLFSAFGFGGKLAQRYAIVFIGFIVFRSFWYYPYDRFLITGLPIGFAAMALMAEHFVKLSRWGTVVGTLMVVIWCARSMDSYLRYHTFERVPENGAHTYRDDVELDRVLYQMTFTSFPLEGADIAILAGRRITRAFQTERGGKGDAAKRSEVVAMEFPWPQIAYALRPRPIVLGFPFVNFWGDPEYKKMEVVPLGPDKQPVRPPRRAIDFLRDRNVKYVITPQPRTLGESADEKDRAFGTWFEWRGADDGERANIDILDTITERGDVKIRVVDDKAQQIYEWPRWIRILEFKFPPRNAETASQPANPDK
jgi:hypothetical protein